MTQLRNLWGEVRKRLEDILELGGHLTPAEARLLLQLRLIEA